MNAHLLAAVAAVLLVGSSAAGADGHRVLAGSWQGGGRACAGRLDIGPRTLSWQTPFSRCSGLPFKTSEIEDQGGVARTLFVFERPAPACPFASVEMRRRTSAAGAESWEAIGHRSEADRQAGRLDDPLACPMVRLK